MSSTDEIKVVLLQETGHYLLPKCEGHATIIGAPQFRILTLKKEKLHITTLKIDCEETKLT